MTSSSSSQYDKVKKYFHLTIQEAAICLGMEHLELRKIVRENGHSRWPYKRRFNNISITRNTDLIQHFFISVMPQRVVICPKLPKPIVLRPKLPTPVALYPKSSSKIVKDVVSDVITTRMNLEQFENMHERFILEQPRK